MDSFYREKDVRPIGRAMLASVSQARGGGDERRIHIKGTEAVKPRHAIDTVSRRATWREE